MISIRGATTIACDTEESIFERTKELIQEILRANHLVVAHITAIFFTCTQDIRAAYPAPAARALGLNNVSLMCMQEMYVEGSLKKCIRLCLFYDQTPLEHESVKHIYLHDAAHLRPDWAAQV